MEAALGIHPLLPQRARTRNYSSTLASNAISNSVFPAPWSNISCALLRQIHQSILLYRWCTSSFLLYVVVDDVYWVQLHVRSTCTQIIIIIWCDVNHSDVTQCTLVRCSVQEYTIFCCLNYLQCCLIVLAILFNVIVQRIRFLFFFFFQVLRKSLTNFRWKLFHNYQL